MEPPGQQRHTRPLHTGRDEGPPSEPDEALVDECCLLPSQLLIPNLDWLPVSDGLVSRLQPRQPLRLHFGRAPALPSSATTLQLDGLVRCVPSASCQHGPMGALRDGLSHLWRASVGSADRYQCV